MLQNHINELNKTCQELDRVRAYLRTFAHLAEREEGAMIELDAESFDIAMSDVANTIAVAHFQLKTLGTALETFNR